MSTRFEDNITVADGLTVGKNATVTGTATVGAVATAGSVLASSATSGIGYTTGAGSTVVQASVKSSAITLNAPTGMITFANDALAGYGTSSSCTWTNTAIASADVVVFNHVSGGTIGKYTFTATCSAGSAVLRVANVSSASLSEAPVVQFAVIKGAQA